MSARNSPVKSTSELESETPAPPTLSLRDAFLSGACESALVQIYENERPLLGLAAELDRLFQGVLNHAIRSGFVTGKAGEFCILPLPRKSGKAPFLITVGMGSQPERKSDSPLVRRRLPEADVLKALLVQLRHLKASRLGVSCQDFGSTQNHAHLEKTFHGVHDLTLFS